MGVKGLHSYIFDNASTAEDRRLDLMSKILDPRTRAALANLGLGKGWKCLELGVNGTPDYEVNVKRLTSHVLSRWFGEPSPRHNAIVVAAALAVFIFAFCGKSQAQTNVFRAAEDGDLNTVQQALQTDPSLISATNEKGETLLGCAAASDNTDLVKLLLAKHADVNARDIADGTPLFVAAVSGHLEVAKLLLDNHADVNAKDKYGATALHNAAGLRRDDIVRLLLDRGADVDAKDVMGKTPLIDAVNDDCKSNVELLLARGAQVNDHDDNNWTALHDAAGAGLTGMVELLISRGADIDARSKSGDSPLDLAALGNPNFPGNPIFGPHNDVAELLRSYKAQYTAFDAAAMGDIQYVKNAVKQTPPLVFAKNNRGKMLLHYAAQQEQKDMAEFLIANKADVNARDSDGRTSLHYAADAGRVEIAELLLANKADVDVRDAGGETPLYLAAMMGKNHADIIELLVEHGADVNAKANDGRTPLYRAIRTGPVADILTRHGGHL